MFLAGNELKDSGGRRLGEMQAKFVKVEVFEEALMEHHVQVSDIFC